MVLLLCRFFIFCAGNKFDNGNPIESNKYKYQCDEFNHNSNNYDKYHLPFEMVYHYSQRLTSSGIKGVYKITMPDKYISKF